jgi:hypothetical protein
MVQRLLLALHRLVAATIVSRTIVALRAFDRLVLIQRAQFEALNCHEFA